MTQAPVATPSHPAPYGAMIYHWHGGLLLLARTLVLERPTNPIAATLRIGLSAPYVIEVEGRRTETRASLVGSKCSREKIIADESDLALFYIPVEWPEHRALRRKLGAAPIVELDFETFAPVVPRLREALSGRLGAAEINALAFETLRLIAGDANGEEEIDPRIRAACDILAITPLDQFDLEDIAARVYLSSSRLRKLFKLQIGYAISEYARWSAVWQLVGILQSDMTITQAAMAAGFFDLAHADKAIVEVFGMSPSLATDARFVTRINCEREFRAAECAHAPTVPML